MLRRTLTVLFAIPILAICLYSRGASLGIGTVLIAVITGLASWEYGNLFLRPPHHKWQKLLVTVNTALILILALTQQEGTTSTSERSFNQGLFIACVVAGGLILIIGGLRLMRGVVRTYSEGLARAILGYVYVGLPMATIVLMLRHAYDAPQAEYGGRGLVIFLLTATLSTDIGALLIGKHFGKYGPKLAPVLSPNKTVIGALGGIVTAVAAILLVGLLGELWAQFVGGSWFFWMEGRPHEWGVAIGLAAFLGVMGQLGDLTESALKRSVNVKDSGNNFTGHGGMLDMIDGLLFTAPAMYIYAIIIV